MRAKDIVQAIKIGDYDLDLGEIIKAATHRENNLRCNNVEMNVLHEYDERSIMILIRETPAVALAVALKNVDKEILERVTSCMSTRARSIFLEEMAYLGPQKHERIREAQSSVLNKLQALEELGRVAKTSRSCSMGAGEDPASV
jgi:hypothetical protein